MAVSARRAQPLQLTSSLRDTEVCEVLIEGPAAWDDWVRGSTGWLVLRGRP